MEKKHAHKYNKVIAKQPMDQSVRNALVIGEYLA